MKKCGFSLMELLLVLAIISIISVMGIQLTKHSTDKAYDLYYYSGYINLYNSIADIRSLGQKVTLDELNKRLGTEVPLPAGVNEITTNNGIKYDDLNRVGETDDFDITMKIPQRKTKKNPDAIATVRLRYHSDGTGYLIPYEQRVAVRTDIVNLPKRRDLLPAYIDDGLVGRTRPQNNGTPTYTYQRIQYRTYRDAFCNLNSQIAGIISCAGIIQNPNVVGVLRIADPRKAN